MTSQKARAIVTQSALVGSQLRVPCPVAAACIRVKAVHSTPFGRPESLASHFPNVVVFLAFCNALLILHRATSPRKRVSQSPPRRTAATTAHRPRGLLELVGIGERLSATGGGNR